MLLILPINPHERLGHLADLIDSLNSRIKRTDRLAIRSLVTETTCILRRLAHDMPIYEQREIDDIVNVAYRLVETLSTFIGQSDPE